MGHNRTIPENFFVFDPAVFAIEDNYCIVFNSLVNGVGWVEVNGERFVNEINGTVVSDRKVHKATVPMEILDDAKSYEVVFLPVYAHKAYFAQTGEEQRKTYVFKAPDSNKENFNIYHISDTHSSVKNPVATASYFGDDLDLLIMNGDIPNHSGNLDQIMSIFEVASKITHGNIPIIYARGNHDTRGGVAPYFNLYTPVTETNKSYYTFRFGKIWGIVMDCGEDKEDDHEELGGLAFFEPFRKKETEFIRSVVKNAKNEYEAEGIETRLVICHIRVDIHWNTYEEKTFKEWINLINEINPDVVLNGHEHIVKYMEPDRETVFGINQVPPTLIGGDPRGDDFKGLALTLKKEGLLARFTNKNKEVLEEYIIDRAKR